MTSRHSYVQLKIGWDKKNFQADVRTTLTCTVVENRSMHHMNEYMITYINILILIHKAIVYQAKFNAFS